MRVALLPATDWRRGRPRGARARRGADLPPAPAASRPTSRRRATAHGLEHAERPVSRSFRDAARRPVTRGWPRRPTSPRARASSTSPRGSRAAARSRPPIASATSRPRPGAMSRCSGRPGHEPFAVAECAVGPHGAAGRLRPAHARRVGGARGARRAGRAGRGERAGRPVGGDAARGGRHGRGVRHDRADRQPLRRAPPSTRRGRSWRPATTRSSSYERDSAAFPTPTTRARRR